MEPEYDVVDLSVLKQEEKEEGSGKKEDNGDDTESDEEGVRLFLEREEGQSIMISKSQQAPEQGKVDLFGWTEEDLGSLMDLPEFSFESGNGEGTAGDKKHMTHFSNTFTSPSPSPALRRRTQKVWKTPPDFKKIPGTQILVDGFQFKGPNYKTYFLSHYHSDHYTGITKTFDFGTIYCSQITARLLHNQLGVDPRYIQALEMNTQYVVDNTEVTFLDANHCPGAVLILFKVNGKNYLHTGDFRYDPFMKDYPALQGITIDGLYLDNTFCDPKYLFPPQHEAVSAVVELVRKEIHKPTTLFLVGTYTIGKEKVLAGIANTFNKKIFVTQNKYDILSQLDMDMSIYTTASDESCVHMVSMGTVNFLRMGELLKCFRGKYTNIIGFQPTGWAAGKTLLKVTRRASGPLILYSVPYSEHSNYAELRSFVSWIKPKQIIPTVDCGSPAKVEAILSHFKNLKDPSESRSTLFSYLWKKGEKKEEKKVEPAIKRDVQSMPALFEIVDLSQDEDSMGGSEPQEAYGSEPQFSTPSFTTPSSWSVDSTATPPGSVSPYNTPKKRKITVEDDEELVELATVKSSKEDFPKSWMKRQFSNFGWTSFGSQSSQKEARASLPAKQSISILQNMGTPSPAAKKKKTTPPHTTPPSSTQVGKRLTQSSVMWFFDVGRKTK